jgi:hypothetical protein
MVTRGFNRIRCYVWSPRGVQLWLMAGSSVSCLWRLLIFWRECAVCNRIRRRPLDTFYTENDCTWQYNFMCTSNRFVFQAEFILRITNCEQHRPLRDVSCISIMPTEIGINRPTVNAFRNRKEILFTPSTRLVRSLFQQYPVVQQRSSDVLYCSLSCSSFFAGMKAV